MLHDNKKFVWAVIGGKDEDEDEGEDVGEDVGKDKDESKGKAEGEGDKDGDTVQSNTGATGDDTAECGPVDGPTIYNEVFLARTKGMVQY